LPFFYSLVLNSYLVKTFPTKQTEKLLNLTTMYEMKKTEIYHLDVHSAEELNSKLLSLEKSHHESVEAILSDKQKEKFRAKVKPIQG